MTIGERIKKLRTANNISLKKISKQIGISESVMLNWETDKILPPIDKLIMLKEFFNTSFDELLGSNPLTINKRKKNKYFGTDGFRGEVNVDLTSMQAYKIGRFLGWYYASKISGCKVSGYKPKIVIGKDTRRSSYMLEYAIASGIVASGADAYMLHVITTPGVSYITHQEEFDCGIMITASHNPYFDNGIKIINKYGEKMDDDTTSLIEDYIDGNLVNFDIESNDLPLAKKEKIGKIIDYIAGRNRYVGYLISLASNSYKKIKVGIDCANGASWSIARNVFDALGAQSFFIGDEPDGINVNDKCGSTNIDNLCSLVKEKHLDIGFAFDGDADRCIAVDENGKVVDGDAIIFILANRLKSRGMLNLNTVVATTMSNSGLFSSLKNKGIDCVQTSVGDRFVYEEMQNNDYSLGGEQSGHIILKKYATTGDGLLTAIMLMEEICDKKTKLSKLCENIILYPQHILNIKVKDKEGVINDEIVNNEIDSIKKLIKNNGRVLLRKSGTEPLIRIMIESETYELCEKYAERIALKIKERGFIDE